MTDKTQINKIKETLSEYERERNRRRSVEAVILQFVIFPAAVLAMMFLVGTLW